MTPDQILRFLRDPEQVFATASDPDIWLDGLRAFAEPQLAAAGDHALRPAQVRAWERLATASAGLVLGPPGTGKTHLLAWFIVGYIQARLAANLPARVFVSAFTRNAIGNLLDAAARRGATYAPGVFDCCFIGASPPAGLSDAVVHRELRSNADVDGVLAALTRPAIVVGGSIWSLSKLTARPAAQGDGYTADLFDLVCIDEASQMVVSHGLMALAGLAAGGRVVVAGDDRQLPPIRSSREIELGGRMLGGSLYGFMKSAKAPECALEETFRLNAPLAQFPRDAFYDANYRSTNEAASKRLDLIDNWREGLELWEADVLDPEWPVAVLLHDGPPAATSNPFEATLVARLTLKLADRLRNGKTARGYHEDLWREQIAIVSPHRAQNAGIRKALHPSLGTMPFVETVDRIQGKERDAVLMSYCVADAEFAVAEAGFIFASERLNVAITRARSKLILLVSRRLLDAVPNDQDIMDQAQLLREFVFGAEARRDERLHDGSGAAYPVQVRLRGFGAKAEYEEAARPAAVAVEVLTERQERLLEAVQSFHHVLPYRSATIKQLQDRLATKLDLLPDLSILHAAGRITLAQRKGQFGLFWVATYLDPVRRVYPATLADARDRIEGAIAEVRSGRRAPFYEQLRERFAWVDPQGGDRFRPIIDQLRAEGLVLLQTNDAGLTVDWAEPEFEDDTPDDAVPLEMLSDADFAVLNVLERIEEAKINFGIFEMWTSAADLAERAGVARRQIGPAVDRLRQHGWLMEGDDGRLRSRMAELAREIRYVKQRFSPSDADDRPYLVRSLKVELRDRDKPERTERLDEVIAAASAGVPPPHARALAAVSSMLHAEWGPKAAVAGFQARSFIALTQAWRGGAEDAFAIAADTGSGKTEAAALPLIAAAAGDRLAGILGVRAILAYPRVRLAANQAQRLAGYLAAFSAQADMPNVTLGLQVAQVPERFDPLPDSAIEAGWRPMGERLFTFPFFACPKCAADLLLRADGGLDGADKLECVTCDWAFGGWVGSKAGLRETPPALFLPTTDSLHQWMHDPRYGRLFGDDPDYLPPRVLIADEIHLYSHIHGAQVGFALQRLAARADLNGGDDRPMLMVGMSATLGDPARAWSRLSGRPTVLLLSPTAAEKTRNPRGREYFYFVQPEVESRGKDIAGASTTIQTLMCLAHGMRRRTGDAGGFRSLVFLDSIDKVRRLHAAYEDAETNKELGKLRTRHYPDDPLTGAPRKACCGQAVGCDAFARGECWWFAATDQDQRGASGRRRPGQALAVADQPVSSKASGRIEAMIKSADIVFATSSLEVGYDDPDINLVYQHYAPQSLASFIQRKGRGGRGIDDRPITGVTLSIYSSRDSWWFRKPHEMIEPPNFDVALNPDNYFVRRGQILAAVLDVFARSARHDPAFAAMEASPAAWREAEAYIERIFGPQAWLQFDAPSLKAFWAAAVDGLSEAPRFLSQVRQAVDWIPTFLFESINLPKLVVESGGHIADEDIALVLGTSAPGNATRRFDRVTVFWRPPANGAAPWFGRDDYLTGAFRAGVGGWLPHLPDEARSQLIGLREDYFRPSRISLQPVGRMFGSGWQSDWGVGPASPAEIAPFPGDVPANREIRHDSRGQLRGFPIVTTDPTRARSLSSAGLEEFLERVELYISEGHDAKTTGLQLARLYWGSDAETPLTGPPSDSASFSQIFTAPDDPRPLLHGYDVQTEGVRFVIARDRLTRFVDAEEARLADEPYERRWHEVQLVRYVVESASVAAGINGFEAKRAADLMACVCSDAELKKDLRHLLAFWSGDGVATLFEKARARYLSQHPMLGEDRVVRVAEAYSSAAGGQVLRAASKAVSDAALFKRYLETSTVQALGTRLKESFVLVGQGDDRQTVMHVQLPLQFSEVAELAITICEAGAHGDGTTRTFADRFETAKAHWTDGFVTDCPNALEDAALQRFFEHSDLHAAWRRLDPSDPAALRAVNNALGVAVDQPIPPTILRILFGVETAGSESFTLYDLAMDLHGADRTLAAALKRPPSAWELVSAAIDAIQVSDETATARLLRAYAALDDAALDDSLSPESRLGDQLYRLHGRLCVDGCQACVHQASAMMSEGQAQASTSRTLLRRFLCT
jgi:ATP-dependent helicase YprA (DUF1998 family)